VKNFQKTIGLFLGLISFAIAQNGAIVGVQLEKNENTIKPQVIKTQIQVNGASSDGIFIELPQGLTAVVRSASLDGNALWLINGSQQVDKNNVLGWQLKNNGIVLHYSREFSGQLDIEIAPDSARLNRFDDIDITIHQVTRNNASLDVDNAVVTKSNLKIKQNTLTDEE
jgi:hypothetical protein